MRRGPLGLPLVPVLCVCLGLAVSAGTAGGGGDQTEPAGGCAGVVRLNQPGGWAGGHGWVAPVEAYELSASFGSAGPHWVGRHTGQDFAVPFGTPVRTVGDGRVVRVSCGGAFGTEIVVAHANGYYSQYAHLASVAVDRGQRVRAGQWIGRAGSTGNSTAPHLHFEMRRTPHHGSGVDPARWLRERGTRI